MADIDAARKLLTDEAINAAAEAEDWQDILAIGLAVLIEQGVITVGRYELIPGGPRNARLYKRVEPAQEQPRGMPAPYYDGSP